MIADAASITVGIGSQQIVATVIFAIAIAHTFSTTLFERLAHINKAHAGLWHLFAEVEVVFGFWALVLLLYLAAAAGAHQSLTYLQSQNFTEPAFIFVIMVIAASKPVLEFAGMILRAIARLLPFGQSASYYFTILFVGPLLGSFITEPAAMTLSALLLRERYCSRQAPVAFKYGTLGVLFVNVSIGGTLTPFAAPPVLMVAERWGWDMTHMLTVFGWKAALAALINAAGATVAFRSYLAQLPRTTGTNGTSAVPLWVIGVHLAFLAGVVMAGHSMLVFAGLFLFFLGFTEAYRRYQNKLILREGLLVGFFLAGLVVLGGQQRWWLQPLLSNMGETVLYFGATGLTAITDNAALTYLGSLVHGLSDESKYALVAGAVSGGGLTVIANAPNPAGFSILKGSFEDNAINAGWLAVSAAAPTLVTIMAFQLLP